jgi:spermidine synthase
MPATGLRAHRTGSRLVQHQSDAPGAVASESSDFALTAVLAACFLLSGVAALIYQTAWTRQLALVFGTSELAVATVLAAYMGGLALGAWLAERWLHRIRRPVLVYAGLELGIGGSALLLVPALLLGSDWALRALLGGQASPPDSTQAATSFFYLLSAFVALALPTVLMGATLPILARQAVRSERQVATRVGFLYSMNTAGAVLGALFSAFVLLPSLGLANTVRVAAAINVVVFVCAAATARQTSAPSFDTADGLPSERARVRFGLERSVVWILPLMLLSGAVSFFHEVLWTRMLSHVLGSSIHAFAVMVASFLAGIALGGGAGAFIARRRQWAIPAFALSQLACAIAAATAFLVLTRYVPSPNRLAGTASYGALLLLPLSSFIGMTFPVAVRILAERPDEAASASARVYAWNTVGAIAGALLAGFVVIPWLRFEGAIRVAVCASGLLGIAAVWMLARPSRSWALGLTVAAAAVCALFRPPVPELLLRASPLNIQNHGRILYYDVGRSSSVVMLEQDGGLLLRTNGLPEAMMDMRGTPASFSGEFWLSPLAVIARPRTDSMLVVGYGGGVVLEAVPPSVRSVDVIELEPLVIEANRATRSYRKRDPLADPRVRIISNDARGALNLTDRKYDAIVSQPSHPWTAGASHLYTLQFLQQARAHLNDGGVFVQWMNVTFVDEDLLRSLAATLLATFDDVRLYRPDPSTLVFLASTAPLDVEQELASTGTPLTYAPVHYAQLGIYSVEDLVASLAADSDGVRALGAGAPLITDDKNRMATSSVYDFGGGLAPAAMGAVLAAYDPLRHSDSWVYAAFRDRMSFDYIARRLSQFVAVDSSVADRIDAIATILGSTEQGYAVRVTALAARDNAQASRRAAREGLELYPQSQVLRYLYVQPDIGALVGDSASPDVAAAAEKLSEPAAAVLLAAKFSIARDWKSIAQLDPLLAQAKWTDPWKFDALQARADWRGRVVTAGARERIANECITLLDEAIAMQPTPAFFGLRARCARAAGRKDVLLESLWRLGRSTFRRSLNSGAPERAKARQEIEQMIGVLTASIPQADADSGVDPQRFQEVLDALGDNIRRLEPR